MRASTRTECLDVLRLVLGEGPRLVGTGLALGLGLALLTGRALASLLCETAPTDPLTLAVVAAFVILMALTATLVPARRALRVDPVTALRAE